MLGIGMGKGMGIGMVGKGGKGSIASMGFSHPSHRLALLSGQVHQTLPPNKIALKMRSTKEEETLSIAAAAGAREVLEREAEATRQLQLQALDREQQVVLAAAQTAALATRVIRQRPLFAPQTNVPFTAPPGYELIGGGLGLGGGGAPTGAETHRSLGNSPGTFILHSSPSTGHLHPTGQRVPHSQLPQPVLAPQSGAPFSMAHYNNSNPDKDGHVKPITAAAVLTGTMNRVR